MSQTPILDSLSEEDQRVIDYAMLNHYDRLNQIEGQGDALEGCADETWVHAERMAALLAQDGAVAQLMRNEYAAAHPSSIIEDIEKPWER